MSKPRLSNMYYSQAIIIGIFAVIFIGLILNIGISGWVIYESISSFQLGLFILFFITFVIFCNAIVYIIYKKRSKESKKLTKTAEMTSLNIIKRENKMKISIKYVILIIVAIFMVFSIIVLYYITTETLIFGLYLNVSISIVVFEVLIYVVYIIISKMGGKISSMKNLFSKFGK